MKHFLFAFVAAAFLLNSSLGFAAGLEACDDALKNAAPLILQIVQREDKASFQLTVAKTSSAEIGLAAYSEASAKKFAYGESTTTESEFQNSINYTHYFHGALVITIKKPAANEDVDLAASLKGHSGSVNENDEDRLAVHLAETVSQENSIIKLAVFKAARDAGVNEPYLNSFGVKVEGGLAVRNIIIDGLELSRLGRAFVDALLQRLSQIR